MNNLNFLVNLEHIDIIIYVIRTLFISIFTYYTYFKIIKSKTYINIKSFVTFVFIFVICSITAILKYNLSSFLAILFLISSLSFTLSIVNKNTFANSILLTIISLSINYVIYFISIIVAFIPYKLIVIKNDIFNIILIFTIHPILLFSLFKIRRFKDGLAFLQKNLNNEYFDILILNISAIILFSIIILNNYNFFLTSTLSFAFILFAIIMFITIQKSLTLYYKHNLLVKELNDTKAELDNKNKEIEKLEKDNIDFCKTSHSIAHKQRALEFKLNKLMLNYEVADELDIRDRINDISKQCFNNCAKSKLPRTEIVEIDDMLMFLQHECLNNNIDFEVQLNGNIHHMINTFIPKEDLTILIADHVKNAIIAINNSDNINKSILVKLGLIDNYYSLYVYDSGIEFEPKTLELLGKSPVTTHSDTGGTGFGFMNIFDTLKKYNASLIINELNPPCEDNYTKSIIIRFDGKNQFSIDSYRSNAFIND